MTIATGLKYNSSRGGGITERRFSYYERPISMFILTMPSDFRIGETAPCQINGAPATVMSRDQDTMIIGPDTDAVDERQILRVSQDGKLTTFFCADKYDGLYDDE